MKSRLYLNDSTLHINQQHRAVEAALNVFSIHGLTIKSCWYSKIHEESKESKYQWRTDVWLEAEAAAIKAAYQYSKVPTNVKLVFNVGKDSTQSTEIF